MAKSKIKQRTFQIKDGNFEDAYAFAEQLLAHKDVSAEKAMETLLVFEALLQKLIDWGLDENTDLDISRTDRLGDFRLEIGFEGRVFAIDDTSTSIEDRLLDAHDDKIDYSYHSGYNIISISVNRSSRTSMVACLIAAAIAIGAYIPISLMLNTNEQQSLLANYVFPLERLYANAALMVGAPMTFFSLLKNLTDTYVVSRRNSGIRELQGRTLATSVFAILLAFVSFSLISVLLTGYEGSSSSFRGSLDRSFADIITSLIPPSIFEPFEAISPIPLIAVAFLCTYALCSAGKYFDVLRQAMMACYTLFSRMLRAVIATLPIFSFLAVLDSLLESGISSAFEILIYFVAIYLGIMLLLGTYAIRLGINGINPVAFLKQITPLLHENARIDSAIDAASYNIRYCSKHLKINRPLLERNVPVLAETNLDGNCFILTFFTLIFVFMTGTELSWVNLLGLGGLILFLSLGAPNQPGSILIGTLIITMYLNSFEVVCMAIIAEALFGSAQNLINVVGDIVMVAIDDKKLKEQEAQKAAAQ